MKIIIVDNTHYKSETCNDGGDYSFTTIYTLRPDNKFEVTFSTSSDFKYCPLCGNFYQGTCSCGMEQPEIVDCEKVNNDIAHVLRQIAQGEEFEIIVKAIKPRGGF